MYMVHSHILQHKDYYKVHSFICVLFYNKNKWVRAENNSETKKCTKSCDEISIAIPKIVDGKKIKSTSRIQVKVNSGIIILSTLLSHKYDASYSHLLCHN